MFISVHQDIAKAAFFSPDMENFIKDGKELSVLLEQGIEEVEFRVLGKTHIRDSNNINSIELPEGDSYTIKVERPENEYYKIQVFATQDRDKAEKLYQGFSQLGYQYVKIIEEDNLYKLRLGKYNGEDEYRPVIDELKDFGLQAWPVKENNELKEQLYLYNSNNEIVFSSKKLNINGFLHLGEGKYNGSIEFELFNRKVKVRNKTSFNSFLGGIIEATFKDFNMKLEEDQFSELLMSYSVILRTNILNDVLNSGEIINPLYKGITEDDQIIESIRRTEGIILGGEKEDGELFINHIYLIQLSIIGIHTALGYVYDDILNELYPSLLLIDLNEMDIRDTVVDARVKWGLRYKEIRNISWQNPIVYTVLDLDLNRRNLYFQAILAQDKVPGLESLESMIRRKGALAGINGGYFDYTRPLGMVYIDNKLVSEPVKDRTALILTKENKVFFDRVSWQGWIETINIEAEIDGINRKPGTNQVTLYNHYYGERAPAIKAGMLELVIENDIIKEINYFVGNEKQKESIIPKNGYIVQAHGNACQKFVNVNPGEFVFQKNKFNPNFEDYNIKTVISAGPRLIKDGKLFINSSEEEFQPDITYGRAPRSAVGITSDNRLVFFTVDGRQPGYSVGITLEQLGEFMLDYGIINGMNLDGGNSASMVVRGFTMNNPSGERLISNAIIIGSIDSQY